MAETPTETLDSSPQAPQISEDATKDNEDQLMTDAPNSNKVPRSDSDTESDSDDDDDAKQNLEIQALETELSSNPSNYDAHIQVFLLSLHIILCIYAVCATNKWIFVFIIRRYTSIYY